MKNLLFIIMVLLIIIISASLVKYNQTKTITENAAALVKDYLANMPVKNATTTNKSAENAAASQPAEIAATGKSIVIDHTSIKLDQIPLEWIEKAKNDLHIFYGHTSHGSQITCGLLALSEFKKSPYIYKSGSSDGSVDLRENPSMDLGNPDYKAWASETRKYLENNKNINAVMWSWCGQLSGANERHVQNYLDLMQVLEKEFPGVTFVYMTGHLDGTGENGTLAKNNMQIREFCISNNKVLFDFADIESYNPDGVYFGDKYANDACDYDSNGDKKPDKNWAKEWQDTHKKDVDWFQCTAAHSQPVNGNMKAYAAWWLMARIVGWDGVPSVDAE